jgi:hypothetical protein
VASGTTDAVAGACRDARAAGKFNVAQAVEPLSAALPSTRSFSMDGDSNTYKDSRHSSVAVSDAAAAAAASAAAGALDLTALLKVLRHLAPAAAAAAVTGHAPALTMQTSPTAAPSTLAMQELSALALAPCPVPALSRGSSTGSGMSGAGGTASGGANVASSQPVSKVRLVRG